MAVPDADAYLEKVAATTNRRVRTDAGDVEKQNVADLLEVERRLRDRQRQQGNGLGFSLFKIKPGGPTS